MELSSFLFLFVFFPISFFIYYIIPKKYKKVLLLIISSVFVATFSIKNFILLVIISLINYCIASKKKASLIVGIIFNVGVLIFYKYTNFILENISSVFSFKYSTLNILVPIGISFYIFQNISYLVDIYKGAKKESILDYLLYSFYFPKVINGPIIRFENFYGQIKDLKNSKIDDIFNGIKRISFGLGKVIVLSNVLGNLWNTMYDLSMLNGITISMAWFGIICYSLYLYLNFSGFIDISIGISKLFNITLPENFDYPYTSQSITDFWRKWHISLSSWFRDYIYIPIGGNRKGNVYINIMIVFFVTGLWHGASWNFILWGIYHGFLNILDKIFKKKAFYSKIPKLVKIIIVDFFVVLGWVMFASNGIMASVNYYKYLFGVGTISGLQYNINYFINFYNIFFIVLSILISLNIGGVIKKHINSKVYNILEGIIILFVLIIAIMFLVNNSYVPSIYANF